MNNIMEEFEITEQMYLESNYEAIKIAFGAMFDNLKFSVIYHEMSEEHADIIKNYLTIFYSRQKEYYAKYGIGKEVQKNA